MAESFLDIVSNYYVIGTIAFSAGSVLILHNFVKNGLRFPIGVVGLTLAIYGGLIGSRIVFILHSAPRLFLEDPLLALAFWQGGLTWLGGPLLGSVVFLVFMAAVRQPGWSHLGSAAPGLALSHALARSACLVRGCCYGRPTELPWGMYSDEYHTTVHPTQAYSMGMELIVAAVLQSVWWKRPDRRKFLMPVYLLILGAQRFTIEYLRGDPPGLELVPGLRFYQVVSVVLIAAGVGTLLALSKRLRPQYSAGAAFALGVVILAVASPLSDRVLSSVQAANAHSVETPRNSTSLEAQSAALGEEGRGRYLLATRMMFRDALQPWIAHREAQGFEVVVGEWGWDVSARELVGWVEDERSENTRFLLIVGDTGASGDGDSDWHMPALTRHPDAVSAGAAFPYDSGFGDPDHNGIPDFAVGRLPVRTAEDAVRQVNKIIEYETTPPGRAWERAVVWTGASGMDAEISRLTDELIPHVPPWLKTRRIRGFGEEGFGSGPSTEFLTELHTPAMISFIASHGALDKIWTNNPDSDGTAIRAEDLSWRLTSDEPLGPLFMLACDTGRYDSADYEGESLAESFLLQPGGPIAVIASSSVTHPMTNYFMTRAMLEELKDIPGTVGEFLLGVQRRAGHSRNERFTDLAAGDALAEYFIGSIANRMPLHTPGRYRHESLSYNLLGDPAAPFRRSRETE